MHMLLKIKAGNGKRHRIFPFRQRQSIEIETSRVERKRERKTESKKNQVRTQNTK